MPELPEVETIRRIVERELVGRELRSIELRLPKLMRTSPMPDLEILAGRTVVAARRRAKVLVVEWSGDLGLLIHFKLAGQLAVEQPDGRRSVAGHPVPDPAGPYPHKATHVIARFAGDVTMYLSDVRQFGWLRLLPVAEVEAALAAFAFGPEAIGADVVTGSELGTRLGRRRIPIKQALLDQGVVAGLGNIYVDEALHRARIHPTRPANALDPAQLDRLAEAIPWSLERGIEQGGAKIVRQKAFPRDGFPRVHARQGEPCPICGTPIVKIRVGGRGTYLCPVCQLATDGQPSSFGSLPRPLTAGNPTGR